MLNAESQSCGGLFYTLQFKWIVDYWHIVSVNIYTYFLILSFFGFFSPFFSFDSQEMYKYSNTPSV